jgi:1-deoxy-D-xylulose-5-phosphate synthase
VQTQKGRGCEYAVVDPCRFHSPSAHRLNGGVVEFVKPPRPTWTETFADVLLAAAKKEPRLVAITAAMPDGTGLVKFRQAFPRRYVDVGICESHAVAMAAGLAKAGLRPVVAIYSTFMQRAFDQCFHELAIQRLPVILCMDRAGLVGSDGAVHHGFTDLAFLRTLPGMTLMAPADGGELACALDLALTLDGPSAIRYPRDEVPELPGALPPFQMGKAAQVRRGEDAVFLALGHMVENALEAAELLSRRDGLEAAVYSARFVKPLDEELVAEVVGSGRCVVTVEDHAAAGGFGSAVLEACCRRGLDTSRVLIAGLPDRFIPHGSRAEQLTAAGLDAASLAQRTLRLAGRNASDIPTSSGGA